MEYRKVAYLPMTFVPYTKTFRFNPFGGMIFGHGVVDEIGEEIKKLGANKVIVITDKGIAEAGILQKVKKPLKDAGIEVGVFDNVETNPSADTVNAIAEIAKDYELVIGLGGGSAIDAAKGAATVVTNGGKIEDYDSWGGIGKPPLPIVAMPTTAGSGAEVTPWAVITDKKRGWKMAIGSAYIIPSLAVCDPDLTLTLPPNLTAETGMDAITHAIEAYTSWCNQPVSEALALKAIQLIGNNLRKAVARGDLNKEARYNMLLGASMAAMAHSNTVCGICHGMAHPLGALFHIPHGIANGMLISTVMEFNEMANPEKFENIAVAMGENIQGLTLLESSKKAAIAVRKLAEDVGLPLHLSEFGIKEKDIEELAEEAMKSPDRAVNARATKKEEFIELYRKML
ncbi:MAG: iron-containing alcohol dehydrogenase [Spirochaetes bacterium]|nr:iron-containing alcohol dehydrogenase [Spirochaetota bacterium]